MQVELTPDLESKLTRLAEQQGRDSAELVTEAVERLVAYDAWFLAEVEKGLEAADGGELTDHKAVRAMIDSRYPA
jgi:predicted transcriptional regulator